MQTVNVNGYVLDFYKNAVKTSFDALSTFTSQSAAFTETFLGNIPAFPEEGKKVVSIYFKESQKGLALAKKAVESNLELDWTSSDAPVKSLETLEAFSKDIFKEAAVIQKELKPLVEKATEQLPKEAKDLVGFSNEMVNSGSEVFQDSVTKSFESAKKTLGDVSATVKKAAK